MPTISTLTVDVNANTSRLQRGLKVVGGAILGVGVIATKMALDYDNAFTKIDAVSNASAGQIARWRDEVLTLAGKTAQAPKELADALFFLASAGLKANQIMPVLEASAKASAAGLGETADVAKLTANVLNAYAGSGLKASKVTDILVAAVREGSADTDEFGTAIGRILPIAATAGVGFDSVAASLASLSNIGIDVNEGVTAMRGLMQALVTPTSASATALKDMHLSAQDLLTSLQQDGLIATLRLLDTAAQKGSKTQAEYLGNLRAVIPNVRALTGALGLTGQEAERVDTLFKSVTQSTGSLKEAFQTTAESAGFKFHQALTKIQVAAIKLGDMILPVLATIVSFLMDNVGPALRMAAQWFDNLSPAVKALTVAIAALGVALAVAFAPLYVAAAIAAAAFVLVMGNLDRLRTTFESFVQAIQPVVEWFQKLWDVIGPVVKSLGRDLVEAATQIWHVLQSNLGPMLAALWSLLQKLWDVFKPLIIVIGVQLYVAFRVIIEVLPVLIAIITKLIEWLAKIIEGALAVVTFIRDKFVEPIINFLGRVVEWIKDHWTEIWMAMKVTVGVVVGPIIALISRIIDVIKTLVGWIQSAVEWLGKLNVGSDVTTLAPGGPRRAGGDFQHGGEVLSTGLAMVHKGEVFSGVNNEMGFGGGLTVIINGDVTGEEVVRKVRDGLLKLKARNATTGL